MTSLLPNVATAADLPTLLGLRQSCGLPTADRLGERHLAGCRLCPAFAVDMRRRLSDGDTA
jgi:hypothetical protein